jgi:hypothetical protein
MKFAAIYSIFIGVGMIAQWFMSYFSHQIPELITEPYRIAFHLAAEFLTAVLLIIAGIQLLRSGKNAKPLYYLATGMLLYTAIVSPGYFAQLGVWAWVWMFAAILILALVGLVAVSKE